MSFNLHFQTKHLHKFIYLQSLFTFRQILIVYVHVFLIEGNSSVTILTLFRV